MRFHQAVRVLKFTFLAIGLQHCDCDADGSGRYIIDNTTSHSMVMRFYFENSLQETFQVTGEGTLFDRTVETSNFTGPQPHEVMDADSVVVEFNEARRITFTFDSFSFNLRNNPPEARSLFNDSFYEKVSDGVGRYVFREEDYEIAIEFE